jgi:hypothetical protein
VAYFSLNVQIEKNWVEKIYNDQTDGMVERILEIPMSLPYMADQEEFIATNTQFEKDGQYFRAIKQRYTKDTLQIVYVPDSAKRTLDHTMKQWISSLVQDELPDSGNNSILSKIFVKDYTQPINDFDFGLVITQDKQLIGFIFSAFENQYPDLTTPPPQVA